MKRKNIVTTTQVQNDNAIEICVSSPYDSVKVYQVPKPSFVTQALKQLFNDIKPN